MWKCRFQKIIRQTSPLGWHLDTFHVLVTCWSRQLTISRIFSHPLIFIRITKLLNHNCAKNEIRYLLLSEIFHHLKLKNKCSQLFHGCVLRGCRNQFVYRWSSLWPIKKRKIYMKCIKNTHLITFKGMKSDVMDTNTYAHLTKIRLYQAKLVFEFCQCKYVFIGSNSFNISIIHTHKKNNLHDCLYFSNFFFFSEEQIQINKIIKQRSPLKVWTIQRGENCIVLAFPVWIYV